MDIKYIDLLRKAKAHLPEIKTSAERFEIPKVTGHIQGVKTVITNFSQICSVIRREVTGLLKYLQRELATPAILDGPRLVLGRKLASQLINDKITQFCKDFVLCRECGKPDTQLIKEDRITFMKCTACGAKQPVKGA
ncbi:MAG TPA: translation initiation factor IF-2 subunit beta [Candidatus Nanoarchaeia archaeon]|nr:translation initiation factor IF-2 subunit beta [Candidatus Nanoarchaeia archaeon]